MSKSLPALVVEMNEVVAQIVDAGGELSEAIEQHFTELGEQIGQKADSYGFYLDRLDHEMDFWKEKAEIYQKVAKACKTLQDKLKENLKASMIAMNMPEIEGDDTRFKISRAAPKLVIDEATLSNDWKMQVTEWQVDRDRIKKAIEVGTEIPGVKQEDVFTLRKYVATKKGK